MTTESIVCWNLAASCLAAIAALLCAGATVCLAFLTKRYVEETRAISETAAAQLKELRDQRAAERLHRRALLLGELRDNLSFCREVQGPKRYDSLVFRFIETTWMGAQADLGSLPPETSERLRKVYAAMRYVTELGVATRGMSSGERQAVLPELQEKVVGSAANRNPIATQLETIIKEMEACLT